jgi:hypothetical protein
MSRRWIFPSDPDGLEPAPNIDASRQVGIPDFGAAGIVGWIAPNA